MWHHVPQDTLKGTRICATFTVILTRAGPPASQLSSELSCRPGTILWFQFTAILSHSLSRQSGRGFPRPVYDLGVKWRREERLRHHTVGHLSASEGPAPCLETEGHAAQSWGHGESVTRPRSQSGSVKVSRGTGSGEVGLGTGSGKVSPGTGSGEVSSGTGSGEVTPGPEVARSASGPEVARSASNQC